jgi:hypothetical protein
MKPLRYSSSSADEEQQPPPEGSRRSGGRRGSGWRALASDLSARLVLRPGGGGGGAGGGNGNGGGNHAALALVFAVGLALGLVASERLYLAGALSAAVDGLSGTGGAAAATASSLALSLPSDPAACACARSASSTPTTARSNHSNWLTPLPPDERLALADLERVLQRVAPTREVLVALSDRNPLREGMLDTFLRGVVDVAAVQNYLVVALDKETADALRARNRNVFYMPAQIPASQRDTGNNHAVSALKFGVLRKFLRLGWSVLLTDVDVAVLSDPFAAVFSAGGGHEGGAGAAGAGNGGGGNTPKRTRLHRDSDVEGMSDGFDPATAYGTIDGYEDVTMGWSRYAQLHKAFNLNSGFFFVRANDRTVELMRRLEDRLSRTKYWDQTAYNEELFFLPHGDSFTSPQCTVRVMDIYAYMNSKVLFKDVRLRKKEARPAEAPVAVHINYHPDKHARMLAVMRYYVDGDEHALDGFPGGSEPGT